MRHLICLLLAMTCSAADWDGYEGGGLRHNASPQSVTSVEPIWIRTFPAFFHPDIRRREGSGYASRNLVTNGDHLAMTGIASGDEVTETMRTTHPELTILDRHTGETCGIFATRQKPGCNSVSRGQLPTGYKGNAVDVPGAFQVMAWDQQTGFVIMRAGGDSPAMSALNPLPVLADWKQTTISALPGAFTSVDAENVHGKKREELVSPMTNWPVRNDEEVFGLGSDYFDYRGSNRASFFSVDQHGPLVVAPGSGSHTQGSHFAVWSKLTGLEIKLRTTEVPTIFHFRDTVLVDNGIIYGIGPAQDADGSGDLGNVYGLFETRPHHGPNGKYVFARNDPGGPDQGLQCWARRANIDSKGWISGFEEIFTVDFPSAHLPRRGPHDAYSYLETDGFQRDKAMLIDGQRMWVAWKPSLEGNVQLCWADAGGSGSIDTGIGAGLRGQDIWPRMSLGHIAGRKHIVYSMGNAYDREYLDQDYPWSASKGNWAEERTAPRGPSGLALIDIETPAVVWTQNLTDAHPSLPINDFWLHADRIQMVVAGERAWIGWVDLSGAQAALALAAYDLRAESPQCEVHRIPLPFTSEEATKSYCTDLISVDGMLYALITESDSLWPGAPADEHFDHTAQHVLAIGQRKETP